MLRYGDDTSIIRMGEYNEDGRLNAPRPNFFYAWQKHHWRDGLSISKHQSVENINAISQSDFDVWMSQPFLTELRPKLQELTLEGDTMAQKNRSAGWWQKKVRSFVSIWYASCFFKLFETTIGENLCSMGSTFLVDRPMSISNSLISVDWKGEKTGEKHEEKTLLKPARNMISHFFHWAIITVILKKVLL